MSTIVKEIQKKTSSKPFLGKPIDMSFLWTSATKEECIFTKRGKRINIICYLPAWGIYKVLAPVQINDMIVKTNFTKRRVVCPQGWIEEIEEWIFIKTDDSLPNNFKIDFDAFWGKHPHQYQLTKLMPGIRCYGPGTDVEFISRLNVPIPVDVQKIIAEIQTRDIFDELVIVMEEPLYQMEVIPRPLIPKDPLLIGVRRNQDSYLLCKFAETIMENYYGKEFTYE